MSVRKLDGATWRFGDGAAYPKTDTMSSEILTIRQTIRCYEGTNNPQLRDRWADKVRAIGEACPEAAPWAAAPQIGSRGAVAAQPRKGPMKPL